MDRPWYAHYDQGVPRSIEYPRVPLTELVERAARKYPNNVAFSFFGVEQTYHEFIAQVHRFAAALYDLGIRKGDRVSLMLPNSPQFLIAFYGALKIGATVVQTNPLYMPYELEHILNDSGTETIVALHVFHPRIEAVRSKTPLRRIIYTCLAEYLPWWMKPLYRLRLLAKRQTLRVPRGAGIYRFQELLRSASPTPPQVDIDPMEDVALFQYTGGTTGTPKAAMLTHFNLVANTYQTITWDTMMEEGHEVVMGALPFFHVYGMTVAMNLAMVSGSKLVLVPKFEVKQVVKLLEKHRVTLFPGAPTMYIAVINMPGVEKHDLSSIKVCISGSAPLPVKVKEDFERLTGAKLVEGYGLSEASPVTHCNPILGVNKAGSIGLPFPDTDAKIVDPETGEREMPVGEPGELVVRGPQVMKGYWNRPEETALTLRDGWLHTGDIARMDEEGYFYIVDRKKDMILASGFNIYPREVEEVLFRHPKVKEVAVIGVPHPYRGETVKAFVVPKEGETLTAEEIIQFCRQNMAKFKCPTEVEFRTELPKTFVGKVLRRVLREEELKKRGQESA